MAMCHLILGPMGDTPIIPPSPYNFCFPFFFCQRSDLSGITCTGQQ